MDPQQSGKIVVFFLKERTGANGKKRVEMSSQSKKSKKKKKAIGNPNLFSFSLDLKLNIE